MITKGASTTCPPSQEVQAADTISVSINASVTPVTPIGNFSAIPIHSSTSRTILKNVKLGASGTGAGSVSGELSDVNFKTTNQTAEETRGTISVVVELNEIATDTVTVPFSISGTAVQGAGADYQITASPVIINPGDKTATIYITLNNDGLAEGDETLILGIDSPINATRGPQYIHTIKIVDPPEISFSEISSTQTEDSGVTGIMIELSKGSSQDVTVTFTRSGNATWGADEDYFTYPGSLTIPSGSLSGMLVVEIIDDNYDEYDETAIISLASPVNALLGSDQSHTLTILDDDTPPQISFLVPTQVVSEEVGEFTTTVALSEISGKPVNIPYTLSGTATAGDYIIHDPSPLTIPPGNSVVNIQMDILEGDGWEVDETLVITLGAPQNAVMGSPSEQTIIITESSSIPIVNFASASTNLVEGDLVVNLDVRLSNAWSQPVVVPFSATGTAQYGLDHDYLMSSSPLEIPVGWTQGTIQVLIRDDVLDENTENILISFGVIENGLPGTVTSHQITIQDNDDPPRVSFVTNGSSVMEFFGTVTVYAELDKPSLSDVTVPLNLSGSAVLNSDYMISTQNLLIPAGDLTGSFQISIVDDAVYDPDENVIITFGSPTNADLGIPATYTLLIEDDELPPCKVGSHLLTIGSDAISLSMVNQGESVLFTGGSITWVDAGGNVPRLISINFAGVEVFSGDEKPVYFTYSAMEDFASLDNQMITYQFNGPLGAGTHSLVSFFLSPVDGSTCSLTEIFNVH